jgi:hypothetical protein
MELREKVDCFDYDIVADKRVRRGDSERKSAHCCAHRASINSQQSAAHPRRSYFASIFQQSAQKAVKP